MCGVVLFGMPSSSHLLPPLLVFFFLPSQTRYNPQTNIKTTQTEISSLTSTPRLSTGLVASLLAHGIRLAAVLGHARVHRLHDIRADRGVEDLWEYEVSDCFFCLLLLLSIANPIPIPSSSSTAPSLNQKRTFGRGCVAPLAEPSAERIETVGRDAIVI